MDEKPNERTDETMVLETEIRETINRFRSKLNSDIVRAFNEAACCECAHNLRMQSAIETNTSDSKNLLKPAEKVLCIVVLVAMAMAVFLGFKSRSGGGCGCGCMGGINYF